MKRQILILVLLMVICNYKTLAQYREDKYDYDPKTYSYQPGDPYSPAGAAVASLFIPGMGQIVSGEAGRGLAFLFGAAGWFVGSMAVAIPLMDTPERDPDFFTKQQLSVFFFFSAFIGSAGIWVCSINDAVRVAKVNNLAIRDKRKQSGSIAVSPVLFTNPGSVHLPVSAGIGVSISF